MIETDGRMMKLFTSLPVFCLRKIIVAFLSSFFILNVSAQNYNIRNFTSDDGLAQTFIYSLCQDANGYLWVGTDNGLARFNGMTFVSFSKEDSLADNFITCSISQGKGVWIGHMNGGLSYFDGKKFHKADNLHTDQGRLSHFAKSPSGRVWGSSYSGALLCLSADSGIIKYSVFKEPEIISTFEFIDENIILVGTNSGLKQCSLEEPGLITINGTPDGIPQTRIVSIVKGADKKTFFAATENDGIFRISVNENHISSFKIECPELLSVQDIYFDSMSNLWICTFGKGLVKLNPNDPAGISYLNTQTGFRTDNVKTVFEDREGNIWSGTYGKGLTRIYSKTFSVIKFENQKYGSNVFSLCSDSKYRWIGLENGLIKTDSLSGRVIKYYGKENGLPVDTVTAVCSASDNKIWIGTGRNGVYRLDQGTDKISKIAISDGSLENSVTAMVIRKDKAYVGTKKGLCSISLNGSDISWYSISKGGLPHNHINSLFSDRSGKVWISTKSNTLCYIENELIHKIPLSSPGGVSTLGPIAEDSLTRMWVGSNGSGIFLIKSDSIVNLTTKEGLFSNYCYSIVFDDHSNAWIGHKGGLSRIMLKNFSAKPLQQVNELSSFVCNPNSSIRDKSGKILIGTDKGIIVYDPALEYPKKIPPSLVFVSVKINDEETDPAKNITLPPGKYKIRLEYQGISLKDPTLVTYQYKLAGYEQWSDISKNNSVTYNNISEGNYIFMLNASGSDGAVTETPLTLTIIVKKPIWKNWWFLPAALIIMAVLTVMYVKRREYRLIIKNRELEKKVLERTQEIQNQKTEIELQRDLIDKKNASITSSIKYASSIQNSVLPSIDLVNKLLPDNFIIHKAKDIVSGDFFWIAERDGKLVVSVSDCTGHGVPGAFMSLLGITLLNEIVNLQGITQSEVIVSELREKIIATLKQTSQDVSNSDGMDMVLCVIDKKRKVIQFTGAMNNLVHIHNGHLNILKADRTSVCVLYKSSGTFTSTDIEYNEGDVFYLFTDGYPDQFGGEYDKKFLSSRFYKLLLEIHKLSMPEQKDKLENRLKEWMAGTEQTDDITVMGIRL
jgi:ligand-binding sensor domain-containing protein/serine phosphatase RsbU (regulator of sigma subunit)